VLGCLGVAARLNNLIEDIAILVDGAPGLIFLFNDADDHLVQVPNISRRGGLRRRRRAETGSNFSARWRIVP
jgi:hypothetical protein